MAHLISVDQVLLCMSTQAMVSKAALVGIAATSKLRNICSGHAKLFSLSQWDAHLT
jgi:hypothetical protein